ncbi:unnamed protein product [Orchesella dallaii]|uniref:Uncharacterized protein n=1 Tax=Orchesella dallaii TaxID=48710 RepID=A0ABP1PQU1_9HEXA
MGKVSLLALRHTRRDYESRKMRGPLATQTTLHFFLIIKTLEQQRDQNFKCGLQKIKFFFQSEWDGLSA